MQEQRLLIKCVFVLCIVIVESYPQIYEMITAEDSLKPPCPNRNERVYLRFKKNNLCYEANTKGPCGENMLLFPHPTNKNYGFCDCFDARSETEEEKAYMNSDTLTHCVPEIRSQLYIPERDRCYSAFDQGPCPNGKWLVLNSTFYPVCAKNTCQLSHILALKYKTDSLSTKFVFAMSASGKCYETLTRGYCAESYELRFSGNHFIPQCRYISPKKEPCPTKHSKSQQIRRLQCKPGSRYDHLTKCSGSINPRK